MEQEIAHAAILIFHHGDKFVGKSEMFRNTQNRMDVFRHEVYRVEEPLFKLQLAVKILKNTLI